MQIRFHGQHSLPEALENLGSVLELLHRCYAVARVGEMDLHINLLDVNGEPIKLLDLNTAQVLQVLEVYKTSRTSSAQRMTDAENNSPPTSTFPYLRLVVDNTQKDNS